MHPWLKYPKFGHYSATDYASCFVRYCLIDREEAVKLVKEHNSRLDTLYVRNFCEFGVYIETEFWAIVGQLYNRDIFENELGEWVLNHPDGRIAMLAKFIPLSVPNLKGRELEYVTHAIETEWVSTAGPYVADLEKRIAEYVGTPSSVAC